MRKCQLLIADQFTGSSMFLEIMKKEYNFKIIRTNELFRAQFAREDDLTKRMMHFIESGEIVPNPLVMELFKREIELSEDNIIIIGFPRTKEQFDLLLILFKSINIQLDKVWHLKLKSIEYVAAKHHQKMNPDYADKYDISKESIIDKIKAHAAQYAEIVKHIAEVGHINTIEVDFENDHYSEEGLLQLIKARL